MNEHQFKDIPFRDIVIQNTIIYPVERIAKLYDYYIENIRRLAKEEEYIELKWYSIDELEVNPDMADKSFTDIKSDSWLFDMFDKKKLGRDILKNGTFWPLTVLHTDCIPNEAHKGRHRITSAKLLQISREWDGRKFLAIDFKKPMESSKIRSRIYRESLLTEGKNVYYVPTAVLYPDKISEDNDTDVVEVPLENYGQVMRMLNLFSKLIRELNCLSIDVTGEGIKPSPIINDEATFKEWYENGLR